MQGNIIGGKIGSIKDHRWQVSIQYRRSSSQGVTFQHFCGGAIIAPKIILTVSITYLLLVLPVAAVASQ